jgi:hypothetical protein
MPLRSSRPSCPSRYATLFALVAALAVAASCATAEKRNLQSGAPGGDDDDNGGAGTFNGSPGQQGATGSFTLPPLGDGGGSAQCSSGHKCDDFPSSPLLDPLASPSGDPATLFGAAGSGTTTDGPCLAEPADGALYPKNWLRPRVYWTRGSSSQTVFEVRVHSDAEASDLVLYTTNNYYALDEALWNTIAKGTSDDAGGVAVGHLVGASLTFTVRGASASGGAPAISNTAKIVIAPAIADGALVYWTTADFDNSATNTTLQGFHVGDEGTTTALTSAQVAQPVRAESVNANLTSQFQQVFCIGCHSATPDGQYVSFTAQWPWPIALASIQSTGAGSKPPWLSNGAIQNLSPDMKDMYSAYYAPPAVNQVMLGMSTFSPAHYRTGDRVLVSSIGASWNSTSLNDPGTATGVVSQIAWFDLEWNDSTTTDGGDVTTGLPIATPCTMVAGAQQSCIPPSASADGGWGIVQRSGDSNSAGSPSWSHDVDGRTDVIAYSSTNAGTKDGRMDCTASTTCTSDVFVVPYGARSGGAGGLGGTAKALPGAADARYNEYYPAWSPDDKLIAYNRVPAGTSMYDQPKAEIYVVAYNGGSGGTPVAVTEPFAPPACTNPYSGGVQNTLPKWAPNPLGGAGSAPTPQVDADGNTFYWITFSSIRSPLAEINTATNRPKQQLYVAGIVVDKGGVVHPYAPIYLWNQSYTVNNLIPAWGEFSVAPGQMPPPSPPPPR